MKYGCQHYKKTCSGLKSQQGAFGDFINGDSKSDLFSSCSATAKDKRTHTKGNLAGREKPRDVKELKAM